MKAVVISSLILLFHIGHGLENVHSLKVRRAVAGDVPDAAKVLESLPFLMLVSYPINGTMLDCFQACQTDFREEEKSATYSWIFPKLGQTLQLDVQAEEHNPGAVTFTVGDDSTVRSSRHHYTDYKTCLVLDFDFHGYQCVLVVTPEFKDNVPQPCVDQLLRSCGSSAKLIGRDHCNDIECEEQ